MSKLTTDEKMIFFFLLKNPQFLQESKNLFADKKFKCLSYYCDKFYKEFNSSPSTFQITESIEEINEGSNVKWTGGELEALFDTTAIDMVDQEWLNQQFEIWFSSASCFKTMKELAETFKANEKHKNLPDLVKPLMKKYLDFSGIAGEKKNMFDCRTMNEWIEKAKNDPRPKQLFSEMIFERETTILFGGPNSGKSTLAIQLCDAWSKGITLEGFVNQQTEPQDVLYVDFETSESQLFVRMHDQEDDVTKNFSGRFHRCSIKDATSDFKESIEHHITKTKCTILVFDNLSYMMDEGEKGKNAIDLIKALKTLREKFNLTIVVLAHTPKIGDESTLSMDHLQGSKMLSNLADSVIGMKRLYMDEDKTYLKQLKVRSSALLYGYENVCLLGKRKVGGMLSFILEMNCDEMSLIDKTKAESRNIDLTNKVVKMRREGKSMRVIADTMCIDKMKVHRILKSVDGELAIIEAAEEQAKFLMGQPHKLF